MKCTAITLSIVVGAWLICVSGMAQVAPPKFETKTAHLFHPHRDIENLPERFESLKCALVLIKSPTRAGTGFYIDSSGDILTASHVIGERGFDVTPSGTVQVALVDVPTQLTIESGSSEFTLQTAVAVILNADNWLVDLTVVRSGHPTKCWLEGADTTKVVTGQHIISLGFPGLAFGSLSLYQGIISARLKTDFPLFTTPQGARYPYFNDFFRVQLPASPGLSGGPVLDDENRVVGVVTNAGAWSQDLQNLTSFEQKRDSQPNAIPGKVDWITATGQLARFFHDWASPGYGDAVPLSYLKRPDQTEDRPHDKPGH